MKTFGYTKLSILKAIIVNLQFAIKEKKSYEVNKNLKKSPDLNPGNA